MTELKNSVSGLNIKLDVAEERISELKDGSVKIYIYIREKELNQIQRYQLEASDANVTCSKTYLTNGKISANQN